MLARRVVYGTESFSWNIVATTHGGVITHDSPNYRPSLNELAHKSYQEFCARLGQTPLTFERWSRVTDKSGSRESVGKEAAAFRAFHGYLPAEDANDRLEIQDHVTARSRGKRTLDTYDVRTERMRGDMRKTVNMGSRE